MSISVETAESVADTKLRTCLLVLGMHRSGTSAVCGVLHQLGAERPVREMPAGPDNEKGYFEPIEIAAIHDRLLASAGLYWFDWEPMPQSWFSSNVSEAFVDELVEAAKLDFPGRGPFLLKDPRICRFVDVWIEVLSRINARPVVVFQYRHPTEVGQSLKARDKISIAQGLLMWLRHIVDAERATRHVERSFSDFSNILVDWQAELAPIVESSRVKLSRKSARAMARASDFLEDSLRHQIRKRHQPNEALHHWFSRSFAALERLRHDPYDQEAMATLDAVRVELDSASAAFSPIYQNLLIRIDHLGRAAAERVAEAEAAQQTLAALSPAAEQLPLLRAELEETRQSLMGIQVIADRVSDLDVELATAREALAAAQSIADRVPNLEAELEFKRQAAVSFQIIANRVPSLEAEVQDARQALTDAQSLADRAHALDAELADLRQRLASVEVELIPGLQADLVAALQDKAELMQAGVALQLTADRVPSLEAEVQNTHQALAHAQPLADRAHALDAELVDTRQRLASAEAVAELVPGLQADLAAALREKAELMQARDSLQVTADRVSTLEAEVQDARQALTHAQPLADRAHALSAELAETHQRLASAEAALAERIPDLQADLAFALRDRADLQQKLEVATVELDKTIGRRIAAVSRFPRRGNR